MKFTGKYWISVINVLENRGIGVVIANPKWIKFVKGNKDDTKDFSWIASLFCIGLEKSSLPKLLSMQFDSLNHKS